MSADGAQRGGSSGTPRFISGVVEGFYGRPWTMEQRTELFKREQQWGLNTYLYAPKDDYKHRMYWRELYSPEEADQLKALISAAKQHQVDFIYAISPGLDITFSNPKEVAALKRKLDQVKQFGCSSFSLLFDDIEAEMCAADKKAFSSFADAQVSITNQVYEHLRSPETFLFCPTDYCAAFCTPTVSQSSYLQTVGEKLLPGIDILWTGPKVVSHKISVESIVEVTSVLKRPPVIWDNIHANDYDPQRLFLGPYKDRPTELIPKLRGVLTNPNCEFYPNFVAIHTLATWCRSADGGALDVEMGEDGQDCGYSPTKALNLALSDWLLELMSADGAAGQLKKDSSKEEWMQTDSGESPYVPGPEENPLYTAEPLTLDDLKLLSDLFYLPYEHGPTARSMLQELDWLKTHSQTEQTEEWRCRAQHFDQMCKAVVQMFNRLSNAPNRRILYDLYNYICDIKSGVGLACAHVKALGGQDSLAAQLMTDDPEPWGFRGGLSGEFQRMLPGHGNRDLFRHPPMTAVYTVRPYSAEDQTTVQSVFKEMQKGGAGDKAPMMMQPPQISDGLSSGEVPPSPGNAFVMEDDVGVCGYAFALIDARPAAAKFQRALSPSLCEDFPSLVGLQVLPRVTDPSPARRMMALLLSSLRSSGSRGAFCELRASDRRMIDFFSKLGSFKHMSGVDLPQDVLVLAAGL
uniref:protein O-GlcNAcase n=1 Tax=Oryzias latipes TaxID=8090 RepID=A0A3P9K5I4_ORYLA